MSLVEQLTTRVFRRLSDKNERLDVQFMVIHSARSVRSSAIVVGGAVRGRIYIDRASQGVVVMTVATLVTESPALFAQCLAHRGIAGSEQEAVVDLTRDLLFVISYIASKPHTN